jgi:hypothetical protein
LMIIGQIHLSSLGERSQCYFLAEINEFQKHNSFS